LTKDFEKIVIFSYFWLFSQLLGPKEAEIPPKGCKIITFCGIGPGCVLLALCYNDYSKTKEDNKMKFNLWRSEYTGATYKMPIDWLPQFGGWQLVATITE